MDTEQDLEKLNPKTLAALAIYINRANKVAGINRITPQVASLLNAYNERVKHATQQIMTAQLAHTLLAKCRERMTHIMTQAQSVPLEEKQKLLVEAQDLESQISKCAEIIENAKT